MNTTLKPTRVMLVGAAFLLIFISISIGVALPSSPSSPESLDKVKEFHANFVDNEIHDKQNSDMGQLKLPGDTILFPWAPQQQAPRLNSHTGFKSTEPQREKITMSGPQPKANVQDLKAVNAVKQRDIKYDESQISKKSADLSNFMDVRVHGSPRKEEQHYNGLDSLANKDPETLVDTALSSDGQCNAGAKHNLGNYMSIDVSGITVSAINTVEGGSAVATSNIVITPVQVIENPSQASEKVGP
ncbi:MAG: hypothetical protein ACE14P_13245 [Methanotrichaceae archaeon]